MYRPFWILAAAVVATAAQKNARCTHECQDHALSTPLPCMEFGAGKPHKACSVAYREAIRDGCNELCKGTERRALSNRRGACNQARNAIPKPALHKACLTGYSAGLKIVRELSDENVQRMLGGRPAVKEAAPTPTEVVDTKTDVEVKSTVLSADERKQQKIAAMVTNHPASSAKYVEKMPPAARATASLQVPGGVKVVAAAAAADKTEERQLKASKSEELAIAAVTPLEAVPSTSVVMEEEKEQKAIPASGPADVTPTAPTVRKTDEEDAEGGESGLLTKVFESAQTRGETAKDVADKLQELEQVSAKVEQLQKEEIVSATSEKSGDASGSKEGGGAERKTAMKKTEQRRMVDEAKMTGQVPLTAKKVKKSDEGDVPHKLKDTVETP